MTKPVLRSPIKPVRVRRKKRWAGRAILVLVLCVLLAGVVAVSVINARFEVIAAAPRISYEQLATPATRIRAVLRPALAKDFILKRVQEKANLPWDVPAWLPDYVLPYELALFLNPDLVRGDAKVTVFVNDQRLGPLIVDSVRRLDVPSRLPYVQWASPTLQSQGRGHLTMDGTMSMLPEALEVIRTKWGQPPLALSTLPAEGNHLFEAVFDNRDGGACAVLASVLTANGVSVGQLLEPDAADVLVMVADAYCSADLTDQEDIGLYVSIVLRDSLTPLMLQGFEHSINLLLEQFQTDLRQQKAELKGEGHLDGTVYKGQFVFTNADLLLGLAR